MLLHVSPCRRHQKHRKARRRHKERNHQQIKKEYIALQHHYSLHQRLKRCPCPGGPHVDYKAYNDFYWFGDRKTLPTNNKEGASTMTDKQLQTAFLDPSCGGGGDSRRVLWNALCPPEVQISPSFRLFVGEEELLLHSFSRPYDGDDFDRCYRLFLHRPAWRARLEQAVIDQQLGDEWAALARRWTLLEKLYEQTFLEFQNALHPFDAVHRALRVAISDVVSFGLLEDSRTNLPKPILLILMLYATNIDLRDRMGFWNKIYL